MESKSELKYHVVCINNGASYGKSRSKSLSDATYMRDYLNTALAERGIKYSKCRYALRPADVELVKAATV